jgi:hypothetical protein
LVSWYSSTLNPALARSDQRGRLGVRLQQSHRLDKHVLEVEQAFASPGRLVPAVQPGEEVRRNGRPIAAFRIPAFGLDATELGPFDRVARSAGVNA